LYEKCLGGKIEGLFRYEGAPGGEAQKVSPEWRNKIMHTYMTIGDQVLMGMDAPPERFQKPQGFHVNIAVKDVAEGKKIFPGTIRKRNGHHALRPNILVTGVRHVRRSFWHAVDGQQRARRLMLR
jgi:hypothetical protein